MQILHAYKVYRPEVEGGIPEVISALTGEQPVGQESSILVARLRGLPRSYRVNGVEVKAVGSLGTLLSMPIAPGFLTSLLLRSARADVIVHHAPFPLTDLAIAGLPTRPALIVHWHADIMGRNVLKAALTPFIRNSLVRADRIIVSHPVMIDQSENLRQFREKCVAIPYGADLDFWGQLSSSQQDEVKELRQRFPRMFVAVGRLVPYKGYSVLLQALRGLNAQLVIIGDGPLLDELRTLTENLGLAQQVCFTGRLTREQIKKYIYASRALAMASTTSAEAFGLVQIEAMAAGRAVINTDLPTAVPFIARQGEEGLTVPSGNVSALRAAMKSLLEDEALANRLGEAARRRAFREFGRQTFRSRNFALYEEAARQRFERLKQ